MCQECSILEHLEVSLWEGMPTGAICAHVCIANRRSYFETPDPPSKGHSVGHPSLRPEGQRSSRGLLSLDSQDGGRSAEPSATSQDAPSECRGRSSGEAQCLGNPGILPGACRRQCRDGSLSRGNSNRDRASGSA
jgi:hypothetical protein